MDGNIRQRLERIRRGEIPEGYRRTKTGMIPDDWNEYPLSTVIEEYIEKTVIPNQYPVLTSARTGLMLQTDYYANRQVTTENNVGYHVLPYGYITFRSRSDDGKFRFNENRIIDKGIISYFYPVFKFNASVCQAYLLETLNHTIYRRMYPYAEGTAQQVLSLKKLASLDYICPPLNEQRAIAEILSAQDRIIALKERLIAEKARQKRYLMQRFFRTDISRREPLAKLAKITMGQSPPSAAYNLERRGIPLIQGNADILNRKPKPRMYTAESAKICRPGEILLSVRAPVGTVAKSDIRACIGRGVCAIDGGAETEYLYQYLLYFENKWGRVAQGSTFEAISGDDIASLQIPLSDTKETVSRVLSAADREIDLLQRSLEQETRRRKALAQYLLSGLVRVRTEGGNAYALGD